MTPEHQEQINVFRRVSNSGSLTDAEITRLLEDNDWNLELALLQYNEQYPEAGQGIADEVHQTDNEQRSYGISLFGSGSSGSGINDQNATAPNSEQSTPAVPPAASAQPRGGNNFFARLLGRNPDTPRQNQANNSSDREIPGAFPATGRAGDEENGLGTTMGQPSKAHQMLNKAGRMAVNVVVFALVIPFFVIYKLLGVVLLLMVAYVLPPIRKMQDRMNLRLTKRCQDPHEVARNFVEEYDVLLGYGSVLFDAGHGEEDSARNGQETSVEPSESLIPRSSVQVEDSRPPRPDFLECAYSEALYLVKREARWLLVYVHSAQHEDTKKFLTDVMSSDIFLDFIKQRHILCWGGEVSQSEAYQVANQFKVNKLPFLGLMCMTVSRTPTASGIQESEPVLSLVGKIQGYQPIDEVIAKLKQSYDKFNPSVSSLRAEYERQSQARLVRRLQDQAYERSLRRDKQRKLEREQAERQAKLRKQWLLWRKATLAPECHDSGEFDRVAIRLPDGKRVQFKFDKHCKLEELYAFVEFKYEETDIPTSNTIPDKPEGYSFHYPFKIVSVMPRREIRPDETSELESCDVVYPSGNLLVERDGE